MIAVKKGVVSIFVTKVLVGFLGLLLVLLTSRYFGAEGRGDISLFLTSITLLQIIMEFGSNSSIINLSYQYHPSQLFKSSFLWICSVGILSYAIIWTLPHFKFLYVVPIFAFFNSIYNLNSMLLMGQQKVNHRNFLNVLYPALMVLYFYMLHEFSDFGLNIYPMAFAFAMISILVLSFWILNKFITFKDHQFVFLKLTIKQGFWVQLAHIIQFLNYRLNFFLIAILIGQSALGIYNNAIVLVEAIWILGHSFGQMLHMKILNSNSESEIKKTLFKMLKLNFFGSVVLLLILVAIPNQFWVFLFDKDFSGLNQLFHS
jgi:O-antigen/teichoic acid export membrane protein